MPANLLAAVVSPSTNVFPLSLSTSYIETLMYDIRSNEYKDGTLQRALIVDGVNPARPQRTWALSKRLTTSQLNSLYTFYDSIAVGGLNPFYFYDPYGVLSGHAIGSNYDATGVATQGRVTVKFISGPNWMQRTMIGRHVVEGLALGEIA